MLNEDHYYPKHRIFALEILDVLKSNGFKYLSLEAFTNNEFETPNSKNGFYTNEPYFGHFIRKAKKLGFTIIGHENNDNSIDREVGQAMNIMKIIENDSSAKIFVYVGHSHIEKNNGDKKWMAYYFKDKSKINPITINQVSICADFEKELVLIPRKYIENDSLTNSSADYFLINNIKPNLNSVYKNVAFKKISLQNKKLKNQSNDNLLVEVFNFKEYEKLKELTVPILNQLCFIKSDKINLYLPIGTYYVKILNEDNDKLLEEKIEVN